MTALTDRQAEILAFIEDHYIKRGHPPSVRTIGDHFGIRSTNGVNDHLVALERKGYLLPWKRYTAHGHLIPYSVKTWLAQLPREQRGRRAA